MKFSNAIFIVFVAIALLDSVYLSVEHFDNGVLACPDTGIVDCAQVLSSNFSSVFGIPIAFLGLAWVVIMLVISYKRDELTAFLAPIWYIVGLFGVGYSFTAQYLIGKICIYCTTLDVCIIAIVLLATFKLRLHKTSV
ncbi:vitamin K epoxide reductase family protein [Candidatus Marsarchaeota archaeon]|nr:vitamin K epoxide reductase family protein [Candidatus Marsarchaeota archaeon]MCL5404892.1 vitamin K epoxide reductase family protein [Candidatus Marsarchaeota archaeon]